ncbi:MAG: ATP-dependent DNA helicase [Candidatus Acidifodinimicrobium sp.]
MFSFPFKEMRPGQKEIISQVIETVDSGSKLMINASTGLGKTVAVMLGALEASKKAGKRILVLTSKHTHQKIFYDTIKSINLASNTNVKFVGVNGKQSMCLLDNDVDSSIFSEFCRVVREQGACRFYSNTYSKDRSLKPSALNALQFDVSNPSDCIENSRTFEVCPYEISMVYGKSADVVIANYSHAFNEDISNSFFSKLNISPKDTTLIIDEAHNLHSKIQDINSTSISLRTLERAHEEIAKYGSAELAKKVKSIIESIKNVKGEEAVDFSDLFSAEDIDAIDEIIEAGESRSSIPPSFTLKRVVQLLLSSDESYLQYASRENDRVRLNIYSLDPSGRASEVISKFGSSILMSGTFKPMDVFADLLGVQDARKLDISDTFVDKNRLIINDTSVTSKFSHRDEQISTIAGNIRKLLSGVNGSSIIFFPSYDFMNKVAPLLGDLKSVVMEKQKMTREEKESILHRLKNKSSVLLSVIGGNFSESIGIENNSVKLIVVVGVPFEPPSVRLKALQNYYQAKFGRGFEYAQVLPSMIKAMQAAGRGIRSEKDRCTIILMDYRFSMFRKYLPSSTKFSNGNIVESIRSGALEDDR